jgi:CRISPR/Cas system CSM-associated protein Csm3 (group 7 of RAMP superfamily)
MLLSRIERHLKARRIPPTRFGRDAVGDPCFVFDLRDGREPRGSTAARVSAYLDRVEAEHRTQAGEEPIAKAVVSAITPATAVSDGPDR